MAAALRDQPHQPADAATVPSPATTNTSSRRFDLSRAEPYLPAYNVHPHVSEGVTQQMPHCNQPRNAHHTTQSTAHDRPTTLTTNGPPYDKHSTAYIWRSLLAGGIAGSTAKTVVAPLDRVKILFQGKNPHFKQYAGSWSGAFRALAEIWRESGVLGLYRGHSATLSRIFPYAALNYMCFEQYKRILMGTRSQSESHMRRLLAGSLAGATSVTLTYPLDYVHSRMTYQHKQNRYTNIWQTILLTMKEEGGVKGLYRGFGPTLLGIIPYAGCSFYTYDTLKTTWLTSKAAAARAQSAQPQQVELSVYERFICGAAAGLTAQSASYPLDTIRRRMQLRGLAPTVPPYRNTWQALKSIIATDGVRGLYVGLSINYIKAGPTHAVSFLTYEAVKQYLNIADVHEINK